MRELNVQEARRFIEWLLATGESNQLETMETKRVSGKMVGKALETVCAFANTRGGWLVLGVEDGGKAKGADRLHGIGENPEAVDELMRKLNGQILPAVEGIVLHPDTL
jgi:ATP-dependent DNA helicase RecG